MSESIVTSIEVSRRLRDMGIPQQSVFYWQEFEGQAPRLVEGVPDHFNGTLISAFTCSEMFDLLPEYVSWDDQRCFLRCGKHNGKPYCEYWAHGISQLGYSDDNGNEAECRGKTCLFLLRNNLIAL